jgi:hypothetical protein
VGELSNNSDAIDLIGFDKTVYSNNDVEKHEVKLEMGIEL